MFLLDSNIFLEVELAEEHAGACKRLLERIREGILKAVITGFQVDSIVLVMEKYGKSWREISIFLISLLKYKGLRIESVGMEDRIKATSIMKENRLSFDDALAVQTLRRLSLDTIVSYDTHFDGVSGIKRKTPEEFL